MEAALAPRVEVVAAARSHPGRVRMRNEDHFVQGRFGRFVAIESSNLPVGSPPARHEEAAYFAVLADGMGGRAGGAEASRLALQTGWDLQVARKDWILRITWEEVPEILARVEQRIRGIDAALAARTARDPDLAEARTTLTAAVVLGDSLVVGHVGDSRAYLMREGRLRALTHDQTLAQLLADVGEIEPDAVRHHQLSHVLTQSIGAGSALEVEVRHVWLCDRDRLLLATDGLDAVAEPEEVERLLARVETPAEAVDRLLELALDRGAPDNVTVLVADVSITPAPGDRSHARGAPPSRASAAR